MWANLDGPIWMDDMQGMRIVWNFKRSTVPAAARFSVCFCGMRRNKLRLLRAFLLQQQQQLLPWKTVQRVPLNGVQPHEQSHTDQSSVSHLRGHYSCVVTLATKPANSSRAQFMIAAVAIRVIGQLTPFKDRPIEQTIRFRALTRVLISVSRSPSRVRVCARHQRNISNEIYCNYGASLANEIRKRPHQRHNARTHIPFGRIVDFSIFISFGQRHTVSWFSTGAESRKMHDCVGRKLSIALLDAWQSI